MSCILEWYLICARSLLTYRILLSPQKLQCCGAFELETRTKHFSLDIRRNRPSFRIVRNLTKAAKISEEEVSLGRCTIESRKEAWP